MRDVTDRLDEIAALRPGDELPDWLYGDRASWAAGMSALLTEARLEIHRLRAAVLPFEDTGNQIINQIALARIENNKRWMKLLEIAVRTSPEEAKPLLALITATDRAVSDLVERLTE